MLDWRRWPWTANQTTVSTGVHRRVEKTVDDQKGQLQESTNQIARLMRKNAELEDQIKLRDSLIGTLTKNVEVSHAKLDELMAVLERRRLDAMAGLPTRE